jgi:hypothetical protein
MRLPLLFAFSLVSCSRGSGEGASTGSASAAALQPGLSTAAASASAAPPLQPTASHWSGTYKSEAGTLYVRDGGEWKGVHFRGDDASIALGDGPLELTVDEKSHRVRGTGSGPLGDVILTGAVAEGQLTFSILRKSPDDRGLTGTGVGKVEGSSVNGVMHLSRGDAHVIREASFSVSKAVP